MTTPVEPGGTALATNDEASAPTSAPIDHRPTRRIASVPNWAITVTSLAVVLLLWEIFGRQINPIFASYPTAIARRLVTMVADGSIGVALLDSMRPMLTGFILAVVSGVPLGLLIGRYRVAEAALGMYVSAGYATPLVAFIPLFMLWFGLGFTVKVAVVFSLTIFPIIINTWAGVQAVPKTLIEVGYSFVASHSAIMRKIIVPSTLPYIMTGLRLGIGRAVIGIVIAEFFTALTGLGGMILRSGSRFDITAMFVPVVVLLCLAIGLTRLVGYLERRVAPWQSAISGVRAPR